jgi:hypothetical protein
LKLLYVLSYCYIQFGGYKKEENMVDRRKVFQSFNANNLYPFLKLYKAMKVILIEILYPKFGLINGTMGIVHKIVVDDFTPKKILNFHRPSFICSFKF